jgi:hypothetical protein
MSDIPASIPGQLTLVEHDPELHDLIENKEQYHDN